jgi:hypothetical protein
LPQAKDFGLVMTIGIAVKSTDGAIVMVSDRMLSIDDYTQAADDGMLKTRSLSAYWAALFSAEDTGSILPIIELSRARMRAKNGESHKGVMDAVSAAYQQQYRDEVTALYLAKYGINDVREFRKKGLSEFGESKFAEIAQRIDDFDLKLHLMVCGFDPKGTTPHIFQIVNPGRIIDRDPLQYWAIGAGAWVALASLNSRPFYNQNLANAVYRACEAKFCSETVGSVGRSTTVFVLHHSGRYKVLTAEKIEDLRNEWEETLKQPVPKGAEQIIERTIKFDDD